MRYFNGLKYPFYLQVFTLLLLFCLSCFALNNDVSFSIIHQQQFSQAINFLFINYSFLGDCIFVFVLSAFVALRYKNTKGIKLFFACLFTFILEQLFENIYSAPTVTLHFEALQHIYLEDGWVTSSVISLNTAMMITCCAMMAKYTKSSLLHLVLIVAVLLMAFCRIYLVQENFWNIMLALPVSFAAFQLTAFLGNNKYLQRIFRNVGILILGKPDAYNAYPRA